MIVAAEQVKVLVDHARTPRDRAIILTHFQGGLDVSTLCSLRFKDVAEGLSKNEHPLKLDLVRPKTSVPFYTFIGKDAIEALKANWSSIPAIMFLSLSILATRVSAANVAVGAYSANAKHVKTRHKVKSKP